MKKPKVIFRTTDTKRNRKYYPLTLEMHNVLIAKLDGVDIPFEIFIKLGVKPNKNQQLRLALDNHYCGK